MTNTATGASDYHRTVTFRSKTHEAFYQKYLPKCRYQDGYHKALVYCLGISEDTRKHIKGIYDFKTGHVKVGCLREAWMTSGSAKIVRMAFNLYCNNTPSIEDHKDTEEQLRECKEYTVEELFSCEYARYFWEAIKIRYPEYCFYRDWEESEC